MYNYGIPHKGHEEIVQHRHKLHNNWLNFIKSLATWELCHKLEAGQVRKKFSGCKKPSRFLFSYYTTPKSSVCKESTFWDWRKT